jgi:hypothetical protein
MDSVVDPPYTDYVCVGYIERTLRIGEQSRDEKNHWPTLTRVDLNLCYLWCSESNEMSCTSSD